MGDFILCIQLFACKSKTKDEPALEPEQASVYESAEFQDFYQKFSTDSVFQMEHIVFPLEGMRSPKDSLDIIDPNFRWQQDTWKIHKPYDDMNGTYIRNLSIFRVSSPNEFLMSRGNILWKDDLGNYHQDGI